MNNRCLVLWLSEVWLNSGDTEGAKPPAALCPVVGEALEVRSQSEPRCLPRPLDVPSNKTDSFHYR